MVIQTFHSLVFYFLYLHSVSNVVEMFEQRMFTTEWVRLLLLNDNHLRSFFWLSTWNFILVTRNTFELNLIKYWLIVWTATDTDMLSSFFRLRIPFYILVDEMLRCVSNWFQFMIWIRSSILFALRNVLALSIRHRFLDNFMCSFAQSKLYVCRLICEPLLFLSISFWECDFYFIQLLFRSYRYRFVFFAMLCYRLVFVANILPSDFLIMTSFCDVYVS